MGLWKLHIWTLYSWHLLDNCSTLIDDDYKMAEIRTMVGLKKTFNWQSFLFFQSCSQHTRGSIKINLYWMYNTTLFLFQINMFILQIIFMNYSNSVYLRYYYSSSFPVGPPLTFWRLSRTWSYAASMASNSFDFKNLSNDSPSFG